MTRAAWLVLLLGCGGPDEVHLGAGPRLAAQPTRDYRAVYEAAWGAVDTTGWTIITVDTPPGGLDGWTDWNTRTVSIWKNAPNILPHELHHVALGPGSVYHDGWCPFGAWEMKTLGLNEMSYLGCQ